MMRALTLLWLPACLTAAPAGAVEALPKGAALYRQHCVACHGRTATSGAGGDIRGLPVETVRAALRGVEQMPAFRFTDAEVTAVTAYLATLE